MGRAGPRPAAPEPVTARRSASALEENVAGLLADGPGAHRDIEVHDLLLDLDDGLEQGSPIDGSIRLARTNRGLVVTGRLRTTLREICVRCLAPVEVPIAIVIDEEALPSIDLLSGAPLDPGVDPSSMSHPSDDVGLESATDKVLKEISKANTRGALLVLVPKIKTLPSEDVALVREAYAARQAALP